jgi:hypothetical protein
MYCPYLPRAAKWEVSPRTEQSPADLGPDQSDSDQLHQRDQEPAIITLHDFSPSFLYPALLAPLYESGDRKDYKKFYDRSHYGVIGGEGWEEVADYALEWATNHASTHPAS